MASSADAKRCVLDVFIDNKGKVPEGSKALVKKLLKEYDDLVDRFTKAENTDPVGAANKAINKRIAIAQKNIAARVEQYGINRRMITRIDKGLAAGLEHYESLNLAQKAVIRKPTRPRVAQEILNQAWNRAGSVGEQALGGLENIKIKGKKITMGQIQSLGEPDNARDLMLMLRSDATERGKFVSKNEVVAAAAPAIRDILDSQQKKISAVGAYMGRIDNYTPQTHTPKRLKEHGKDQWIKDIREGMDLTRITNPRTGMPLKPGEPKDEAAFQRMAEYAFRQITEGPKAKKATLNQGGDFGSPDMNLRRAHSRFFQFTDGQAFIDYNAKYGVGDKNLFNSLLSHIQRNGRDLGVMEKLGPRPRGFHAAMRGHMGEREDGMRTYNAMFRELMGDTGYVSDNAFWQIFEGTKNVLRSALLGNAAVAALPDATLSVAAARLNGLTHSSVPGGHMARYLRAMTSGAETVQGGMAADMQLVSNATNVAEIAARSMGGLGRMAEGGGDAFADAGNKLARFTMDKSGLSHMTLALERTSSYTMASDLGLYNKKQTPFDQLNPQLKASLAKAGITPDDWAVAMKADRLETRSNAELLPTSNIYAHDPDVGQKFADWDYMLRQEVKNGPDLKLAAWASGRTWNNEGTGGRGTFGYVAMSSTLMFKSFPIQILRNFTWPMVQRAMVGDAKFKHARILGSTVATSLVLGYFAFGMKEWLKGREWPDPLDRDGNPNLAVVGMSAWQAGTGGLIGDHIFKDNSGFGRNPAADLLLGPMGGLFNDIYDLTRGNIGDVVDGDETRILKETTDLVRTYAPGQIWQVKALIRLMVEAEPEIEDRYDDFMTVIDPNHRKNKRTRERKRLEDLNMN